MAEGRVQRVKEYVGVVARHDCDGNVTPQAVLWEDGRRFPVDEVMDVRQAASSKAGGNGIRYLIRVGRTETYLYFEGPRWFVEKVVAEGVPTGRCGGGCT